MAWYGSKEKEIIEIVDVLVLGIDMTYCRKCGRELTEDMSYCPSCGTPTRETVKEELSVSADDLIKKVKEIIHEGNVTRIVVKDDEGRTLVEIPATVGVIGAILAPWMAALGAVAAVATRCTIVVERSEEKPQQQNP